MDSSDSTDLEAARRRAQRTAAVKVALRDLRAQLARLNHHVGARLDLRDVDLDCLDTIARAGPLGPSALARLAGLHPATLTGILDRLERGGWVVRERDPADRRAVVLRIRRERGPELLRLYAGMNAAMDRICSAYSDEELRVIADFLTKTADAGSHATETLADQRPAE